MEQEKRFSVISFTSLTRIYSQGPFTYYAIQGGVEGESFSYGMGVNPSIAVCSMSNCAFIVGENTYDEVCKEMSLDEGVCHEEEIVFLGEYSFVDEKIIPAKSQYCID